MRGLWWPAPLRSRFGIGGMRMEFPGKEPLPNRDRQGVTRSFGVGPALRAATVRERAWRGRPAPLRSRLLRSMIFNGAGGRGMAVLYWLMLCCCCATLSLAQQPFGTSRWTAEWIDSPNSSTQDYGVYHFRKTLELATKPASFVVYVSGDNRYEFYVNGKPASHGPASGDVYHWHYETVDLAPLLRQGRNTLAAVVWNDGKDRGLAFLSVQTAFILQAEQPEHSAANTNAAWRAIQDFAYTPQTLPQDQRAGYYVAPPNERFDASKYPWNWQQPEFDDAAWPQAHAIEKATLEDSPVEFIRWRLTPRTIPMDEQKLERMAAVRQSSMGPINDGFLKGTTPLIVPAHTKATLLLDHGRLTTAYPEMTISGGRKARIDLQYAEALYVKKASGHDSIKGNRNDIEGKTLYGPSDTYLPDGESKRVYRTLYWRTFRYLKLEIETQDDPVTIDDLHSIFTAYPFERKAVFEVDAARNDEIQSILSTGFRTARLCAHETYMDCPFYEQLQYSGDARIQMMVSIYMTGDARLMKNGIAQIDATRIPEGVTYSRAPSASPQFIPGFSLWWIGMVHDYMMYVDDAAFVRQMLPGVRAVLAYFARYQKPNGSMRELPWWNFADWVDAWPRGIPPADADGGSTAIFDLQLALAYGWAADLEKAFGNGGLASEYQAAAAKINKTVWTTDWNSSKGMLADQPSQKTYSQHASTLGILSGAVPEKNQRDVLEKILADDQIAGATIYFRAYTNAALRHAGLGDRYLVQLTAWRRMLADGLSTWAEKDGTTRSDCHAWGASPNYELLRTVAGIDSMAPGFAEVRVAPHLGELRNVKARVPHPKGEIAVDLTREGTHLRADVELPAGTTGEFEWRGVKRRLKTGHNHLAF